MICELPMPNPMQADPIDSPTLAEVAVEVQGVGKRYKIYPSPWHRAREWASFGVSCQHEDFWALRNVSFSVRRGECLGIIGINGSGKSTLLKIITGCAYATEGQYSVRGRVLSLLELGTGMNALLTGRQNVINSARLLALPPGYAVEKMPDIEAFAELGEFFDRPIRVYSTGMMMRLAFSMFVALEPDVFIVDEALSVGDIFFQQKCVRRIEALRSRGTTLLFVSHDLAAVERLCDQVLLLHRGRQEHFGDKITAMNLYHSFSGKKIAQLAAKSDAAKAPVAGHARSSDKVMQEEQSQLDREMLENLPWQAPNETEKVDTGHVRIDGYCLRREDGQFTGAVHRGDTLDIFVRLTPQEKVGPLNLGITVHDRHNQLLYAQTWLNARFNPVWIEKGQTVYGQFSIKMELEWGYDYSLGVGAAEAIADPQSPSGWDQSHGGERFLVLPRCAVVSILQPASNSRDWFGPSNLRGVQQRLICSPGKDPTGKDPI
jgi:lipopolysaccharide transport system ATP-binding protein